MFENVSSSLLTFKHLYVREILYIYSIVGIIVDKKGGIIMFENVSYNLLTFKHLYVREILYIYIYLIY